MHTPIAHAALPTAATVIRTVGLSKAYDQHKALDGLDIEVKAGEVVGLFGPNGAGKTTTLKLLLGMLRPSRGHARVLDLDCTSESTAVKRVIGHVPEEPSFYEFLTGRETLAFVAEVRGIAREVCMQRLESPIRDLQFHTELDQVVGGYSMGMRKKLAVLAAVLHQPQVLLLDEPFNGLDTVCSAALSAMIGAVAAQGVAVLLSTHLIEKAEKLCDRAVVLAEGRLRFAGTTDELRASAGRDATLESAFLKMTARASQEQPS